MEKKFVYNVLTVIVIFILLVSCSKTPKFDHYGVYVKGKEGFREIKGYEWSGMNDIYRDSRNFDQTQILFESVLEIFVYSPKAKLTDYKLIKPDNKSRKGNFMCANYGYGRNCPEEEFAIEPFKDKDDMIKIVSKTNGGTLILHNKEESKGYVFNSKNIANKNDKVLNQVLSEKHLKKYKKEIHKTVKNWIVLIKEEKYKNFVEDFKNPFLLNALKDNGDYDAEIEDTIEDAGLNNGWEKIISQFEKILQETPILEQNHISFNDSWIELCRVDGKWHQYIELKE